MQRGDEDGRPRAQRREEATRGRGAAERMGQGPIEEEGGEGIGRREMGIEERERGSSAGSSSPWLDACVCVCGGGQREREGEICVGAGIGRG